MKIMYVIGATIGVIVVLAITLEVSVRQAPAVNTAFAKSLAQEMPDSEGSFERPGVTMHYTVYGKEGPVVVMLAGGPGSEASYMKPIAVHLRNRYRAVLLEQRGTGRSALSEYSARTLNVPIYIEDVEALRQDIEKKWGVQKISLIGNSWGMMLALAYSGTYPERVDKVISVGSGPISDEYSQQMSGIIISRLSLWQTAKYYYALVRSLPVAEVLMLPGGYFYDHSKVADFLATFPEGKSINPQVSEGMHASYIDFRPLLKKITAPALIIQGEQDIVPSSMAAEIKDLMPTATVEVIPRMGHMPAFEDPVGTYKKIDQFLAP